MQRGRRCWPDCRPCGPGLVFSALRFFGDHEAPIIFGGLLIEDTPKKGSFEGGPKEIHHLGGVFTTARLIGCCVLVSLVELVVVKIYNWERNQDETRHCPQWEIPLKNTALGST